MRQTPFQTRRSATLILLLINVAVFLAEWTVATFSNFSGNYYRYFALSLEGLRHGYVWQLLTYQFMHAGPLHLLFNCWAIYVFGRDVEEALRRKNYLALYFSSGVIGGLVQVLAGLVWTNVFGGPVVGASAAAFGLASAFALLFPDRILLLFFIIPMRAKFLLLLAAGLALYGFLSGVAAAYNLRPPPDNIAHAAHLGGMLTGLLFVRYAIHWNWHWPRFGLGRRPSPRKLARVTSLKSGLWGHGKIPAQEDLPPEEFVSKEVDPILDKISARGMQSLTERERRILETARRKMSAR